MGASAGGGGTMRAQYHLRQIAVTLNLLTLNRPELFVRTAADKFDAAGRLTDEPTRAHLAKLLTAFEEWLRRLHR